ncbi:MAG: hypothetical protein ACFFB5_17870 [Promethearchaeota archaeon]
MPRFCSKCGGRVVEDSIFCEYCGNKLRSPQISQKSFSPPTGESTRRPVFSSYNKATTPSRSPSYYRSYHKSSSQGAKWLLVGGFAIIVIVGFAAIVFLVGVLPFAYDRIVDKYDYIGKKTFSIDSFTNKSNLELEIDNSVGAVNIEILNMSNLIEAQILVYAQEGHSLQDANTFEIHQYDDLNYISFDSSSRSSWENPYYYDLEITISSLVTTALDIDVSTGAIGVEASESNISLLSLKTRTGSITSEFYNVFFGTSHNLTMQTSTGSIQASFNNIDYASDKVEWILDTSTGSIDFDILQEMVFNDTQVNYLVDTSTGSINFRHSLHPAIGLLYHANVSTGAIYTSGQSIEDNYTYKSQNYDLSSMKYYLLMDTSTGSISISSFR